MAPTTRSNNASKENPQAQQIEVGSLHGKNHLYLCIIWWLHGLFVCVKHTMGNPICSIKIKPYP